MHARSHIARFIVAAVAWGATAGASEDSTSSITQEPAPGHSFSLTFSPIHLALPMVEVTGEFRAGDKVGAAVIAGAGRLSSESTGGAKESFGAYEAGAQLRYYVLGTFDHGMQLGAELLYVYVDRSANDASTATGAGLAVGPFVGYKIATDVGFTFDAQVGAQYGAVHAKASDGTTTATASDSGVLPLLNLNVGWSF